MAVRTVAILADMEGVAGICRWDQVNGGAPQYEAGRRLYTGEINAAVRGCRAAGVERIVVHDGHGAGGDWSFQSLLVDQLEPGAEYVLGYRWCRYTEVFETGCDAVLLLGAHARAGANGLLSHTVSTEGWHNAWINGRLVGESGFLAALAGHWNVPVAWVSGDDVTCAEVTDLLGDAVVGCEVKQALGRYGMKTLCHADACAKIEASVMDCLTRTQFPAPFQPPAVAGAPAAYEIKVEITNPDRADGYLGRPGVSREGRCVVSRGETYREAWQQFWR